MTPDASTRLAFERTFLAHERTQMAWVRTGLALISFGFGIAKFFQYLHEQREERTPLFGATTVGVTMIVIALVSLFFATLQHRRSLKAMHAECAGLPRSTASGTLVVIMVMGMLALFGALVRQ